MKRIKSLGLSICALLLAVAIFISTGASVLALADEVFERAQPEFISGAVETVVELGEEFDVPVAKDNVSITVKAPNGQPVQPNGEGKIYASQLGNYTVEAKDSLIGRTAYTYNVYCSMTRVYDVYVEFNGAKIPTFMKTGASFEVPDVFLAYTDDDGELVRYDVPAGMKNHINGFEISVDGASGEIDKNATTGKYSVTAKSHGTMILKYSMSLFEGKFYSKEYKITVQNDFKNESKPKLNIVNVPSTANINTKTTLPIATATSSFDERVYVEIKIWHEALKNNNNPEGRAVTVTDIDEETGYAIPGSKTNIPVVFDNVRDMYFYPTELGTYRVSYKAIDTSGNESTEHYYNIECTDGLAPIFVDFDRSGIPNKWGLSVKNEEGNLDKASINLPIPDVRDNADGYEDLTVSVRIIDSQSKTVLRFSNILHSTSEQSSATNQGHVAKNALYDDGKDQTFTANGYEFDFNKYDSNEKTGTYTIEYRVSDSKGKTRTYSPSITVEVSSAFEDTKAPQIDPLDTVRYILLGKNGDETLEIPAAIVSDDNDTNPAIEYSIAFTDLNDNESLPQILDKEAVLDIVERDGKYYLENDKGFSLEISNGELTLSCLATDDAGNKSETQTAVIAVYLASSKSQNELQLIANFDKSKANLLRVENNAYKADINLGNFKITGANDVKFAGFEVLLKNPNDAIVAVSLERMLIGNTIYVKNLSFAPKMSGWHDLYIRVFDVIGNSKVYLYSFEITGQLDNDNPYAQSQSATIPTTGGSVTTRYALKNAPSREITPESATFTVLRVSGNTFSLIGYDFIANASGTYLFQDYTIPALKCEVTEDYKYDIKNLVHYETYNSTVNASTQPVIELLGNMPTYNKKTNVNANDRLTHMNLEAAGWVVLPSISAFNKDINAKIEIKITRDNTDVTAYKVYQKDLAEGYDFKFFDEKSVPSDYYFANRYAFAPTMDGTYTVTYTAIVNSVSKATNVSSILVGKITGPNFTLNESARKAYTIGAKFSFFTVASVTDDAEITDAQINSYTYTKKLIDPSGNAVVNISGNDKAKYGAMTNNDGTDIILDKNGTYTEVYEVTDLYGNKTTVKREFQVASKSRGVTLPMKMFSVILIIVAVLLLVGVIFYIVRFRRVKKIRR